MPEALTAGASGEFELRSGQIASGNRVRPKTKTRDDRELSIAVCNIEAQWAGWAVGSKSQWPVASGQ